MEEVLGGESGFAAACGCLIPACLFRVLAEKTKNMNDRENDIDFSGVVTRAMQIRQIYHELEKQNHGAPWSSQEDMVGFVYDVGELGRMVMASEGRWVYPGDLKQDLGDKLSECLWWVFVLSGRLGIDLNTAFAGKMAELESSLSSSMKAVVEKTDP